MKVIIMGNHVTLFNLPFVAETKEKFVADLLTQLKVKGPSKRPAVIFTPNPEQLVLANTQPNFQKLLLKADYLLPDGIGLVKASQFLQSLAKLRGKTIPAVSERIAGVEVVKTLVAEVEREWPILLVGGRDYGTTANLLLPLKIAGRTVNWFTGFQSVNADKVADERNLRTALQELMPKVVFVAFGAPTQEAWTIEHLEMLEKAGVRMVMVVGGSFDILTGKLHRAPDIWQKLGLEWLFRLIQEPSRWQRQVKLITFMGMTLNAGWQTLREA